MIALHSEFEETMFYNEDLEDVLWRELKRGGGSRGSRSRAGRTSYGNCYGDRCDGVQGDATTAIIVGSVIGGCCLICIIWIVISKCKEHMKEQKRIKR